MRSCIEKKQLLSGAESTYKCELVALHNDFGILKYLLDRQQQVGNLVLQPGTVSYGFYWPGKPYVLYKWLNEDGNVMGDYLNVADSVILSVQEFSWRDLIVDVLILPTKQAEILDEDEVPESLDQELKGYIESVKQFLLQNYRGIISEASGMLDRYAVRAE
jgi:predicted RNA-binding protein associated with RNAse of E/G family